MDQDRWLERLDGHMERGNWIMQRSNEVMLRNEVAFRDLREFLADQTLVMQDLTRAADHIGRRTDRLTVRMDAEHREFVEEMRAQRRALFKVLDRLDRNGGEPAGA